MSSLKVFLKFPSAFDSTPTARHALRRVNSIFRYTNTFCNAKEIVLFFCAWSLHILFYREVVHGSLFCYQATCGYAFLDSHAYKTFTQRKKTWCGILEMDKVSLFLVGHLGHISAMNGVWDAVGRPSQEVALLLLLIGWHDRIECGF
jgi:hypothetical protein